MFHLRLLRRKAAEQTFGFPAAFRRPGSVKTANDPAEPARSLHMRKPAVLRSPIAYDRVAQNITPNYNLCV